MTYDGTSRKLPSFDGGQFEPDNDSSIIVDDIIPSLDNVYDIGNPTKRFKAAYISTIEGNVQYDNTISELSSTNVQNAIDELDSNVDFISTITQNQSAEVGKTFFDGEVKVVGSGTPTTSLTPTDVCVAGAVGPTSWGTGFQVTKSITMTRVKYHSSFWLSSLTSRAFGLFTTATGTWTSVVSGNITKDSIDNDGYYYVDLIPGISIIAGDFYSLDAMVDVGDLFLKYPLVSPGTDPNLDTSIFASVNGGFYFISPDTESPVPDPTNKNVISKTFVTAIFDFVGGDELEITPTSISAQSGTVDFKMTNIDNVGTGVGLGSDVESLLVKTQNLNASVSDSTFSNTLNLATGNIVAQNGALNVFGGLYAGMGNRPAVTGGYTATQSLSLTGAVEASIVGSGFGSLTTAANLIKTGSTSKILLGGSLECDNKNDEIQFNLKINNTSVSTFTVSLDEVSSGAQAWQMNIIVLCKSDGVAGSMNINTLFTYVKDNLDSKGSGGSNTFSIDTTVPNTFGMTAQWLDVSAGNILNTDFLSSQNLYQPP